MYLTKLSQGWDKELIISEIEKQLEEIFKQKLELNENDKKQKELDETVNNIFDIALENDFISLLKKIEELRDEYYNKTTKELIDKILKLSPNLWNNEVLKNMFK